MITDAHQEETCPRLALPFIKILSQGNDTAKNPRYTDVSMMAA